MVCFNRGIFEGFVESFDLAIGPRMFKLCKFMYNVVFLTYFIKRVGFVFGLQMIRQQGICELRPVICQNSMNFKGAIRNQIVQKRTGRFLGHIVMKLHIGVFGNTTNADKKVEFLPSGQNNLGDVNMHIPHM